MEIKYYDNSKRVSFFSSPERWNPNADYAEDDYIRVIFRIDCPSYHAENYVGFATEEEHEAFYDEAGKILNACGYFQKKPHGDFFHGEESIFVHPQEFVGIVRKRDVKRIAETINTATLFHVPMVDLYETVYDMDDETYTDYLRGKSSAIKAFILEVSKTKRRDLYKDASEIMRYTASKFALRRLGKRYEAENGWYGITADFCFDTIKELIAGGYLVSRTKGDMFLIRTINKTEQRKLKLPLELATA